MVSLLICTFLTRMSLSNYIGCPKPLNFILEWEMNILLESLYEKGFWPFVSFSNLQPIGQSNHVAFPSGKASNKPPLPHMPEPSLGSLKHVSSTRPFPRETPSVQRSIITIHDKNKHAQNDPRFIYPPWKQTTRPLKDLPKTKGSFPNRPFFREFVWPVFFSRKKSHAMPYHPSGQIIATSHDLTSKPSGLDGKSPAISGNLGRCIIWQSKGARPKK